MDKIIINIIRNKLINTKIPFLSYYSLHKITVNFGIIKKSWPKNVKLCNTFTILYTVRHNRKCSPRLCNN